MTEAWKHLRYTGDSDAAGQDLDGFNVDLDTTHRRTALDECLLGGNNPADVQEFMNGYGIELVQARFRPLVEGHLNKKRFRQKGIVINPEFSSLPYVWHKPRKRRVAYFADCLRVTRALASQLGYTTIHQYLKTRGWLLKFQKETGTYKLQYRKLEDALKFSDSKEIDGEDNRFGHLGAFVDELYSLIKNSSTFNEVTGKPVLEFLEIESFRQKLNDCVQTMHVALKVFITKIRPALRLDELPNDYESWIIRLFGCVETRGEFHAMQNHILIMFPNDGKMTEEEKKAVRHMFFVEGEEGKDPTQKLGNLKHRLTSAVATAEHLQTYSEDLSRSIAKTFTRSCNNTDRNIDKSMLLIRSRVRDIMYAYLDPHEKANFTSLTRRKMNRKKRSGADLAAPAAKLPRFSRTDEEARAALPNLNPPFVDEEANGATLLDSLSTVLGLTAVAVIGSSAPVVCRGPFIGPVLPRNRYNDNLDSRFDPSGCRMMDFGELKRYAPILHVRRKAANVQVHESTSYFYSAKGFRDDHHAWTHSDPTADVTNLASAKPVLSIYPLVSQTSDPTLSVVRSDHSLYKRFFGPLRIEPAKIAHFVAEYGHSSGLRDAINDANPHQHNQEEPKKNDQEETNLDETNVSGGGPIRSRVELGAASAGQYRLFGFQIFDPNEANQPLRVEVRRMIADIGDACQALLDHLSVHEWHAALPYNFPPRTVRFGKELREALGAKRLRFELATVIAKCYQRGDQTLSHQDKHDCSWAGYQDCVAFAMNIVDCFHADHSIRLLFNSRSQGGDFFNNVLKLNMITNNIVIQLKFLDEFLVRLHCTRDDHGSSASQAPTHKTLHRLSINHKTPWSEVKIGAGITIRQLEIPAGCHRYYYGSAPATIIRKAHIKGYPRHDLIGSAVVAAYEGTFHRFFEVGRSAVERERNKDDEDSFSLHMAKQLLSTFGTVTGTLGSFKRSSPSNIDFANTFLDDYNEGFSPAWKSLLDTIDGLLLWIESETFAAADLEEKIKELKPELALVNSDIGEFRMTTIIQILVMSGVVVVKNYDELNSFQYPIDGLGAAKQLLVPKEERPLVLDYLSNEFHLQEFGTDGPECCLCETADNRLMKIFDNVFEFQDLFYLFKNLWGVKEYGTTEWRCVLTGLLIPDY
jgi:hypothetical protein